MNFDQRKKLNKEQQIKIAQKWNLQKDEGKELSEKKISGKQFLQKNLIEKILSWHSQYRYPIFTFSYHFRALEKPLNFFG